MWHLIDVFKNILFYSIFYIDGYSKNKKQKKQQQQQQKNRFLLGDYTIACQTKFRAANMIRLHKIKSVSLINLDSKIVLKPISVN